MIVSVLIVPLVALVALWVFAATVTVGDSLRLLQASTFDRTVVRPTEALINALQNERRMSLAFLSRDTTIGRVGFDAQRALTDQARSGFITASRSDDLNGATTAQTRIQTVAEETIVQMWTVRIGPVQAWKPAWIAGIP